MVLKYLEVRGRKVSANTWNRDRKDLNAMFNWLRKVHGIYHNPVANIDRMPAEHRPEYIPPAEDIDKVMMAADAGQRVLLKCYYYTFARKSELYEWTWEDINFENEWYRLWTRKRSNSNREADYFPMPEGSELYEALKWQWDHRDPKSPYVFTNPHTETRYVDRRRMLQGVCKTAGVKPFGYKAFRKFGPSVT